MRTSDIARPLTAQALNENLYKQFNVKINFDKYDREQLENYRNLLRSKVHATETQANFNDLLTNETYQKDKYMLSVLNTKIKEMLGESIVLAEKAVSKAQQQAAGIALAAKRSGKKPAGKGASAEMSKMSTKELEKFAGTKHKGLPKHKKTDESVEEATGDYSAKKARAGKDIGKPGKQFAKIAAKAEKGGAKSGEAVAGAVLKKLRAKEGIDQDKDGDNDFDDIQIARMKAGGVPKKKAIAKAHGDKIKEAKKPDFLDLDKDGNKKETMKKAAKDKKKVKESSELKHAIYQKFIAEGIANYIAEDEEGKAKSITAAADMVNDFTSWMQRVGNYQTKSMIELADNIRANFGMQESEQFKQSVGSALESALTALTQAREEINNAVAVLAGEAPAEEPMGMEPDLGMEEPGMEVGGPDDMNMPADEFAAADAAAGGDTDTGRMKRESIERGNRLMKILGS